MKNLEIIVPSLKEIGEIISLFADAGGVSGNNLIDKELTFDGIPIIIDNNISRWFVRKKKGGEKMKVNNRIIEVEENEIIIGLGNPDSIHYKITFDNGTEKYDVNNCVGLILINHELKEVR